MMTRVRRASARLALVIGIATVGSLALTAPAYADVTLTQLNVESFTGASTVSPNWVKPDGGNVACLTAGTNAAQSPIPGCQSPAINTAGNGTLRLTSNVNSQVGTVFSTVSLPTAQGLDIRFNSYQYGSSEPADGIAFILAATNPSNPAAPAVNGPLGGSLGYSAAGGTPGVSYGYLGFGLDVFGNYESNNFGGTGCPTTGAAPNSVAVRGPGQGTAGYCLLKHATVGGSGLDKPASTTRPAPVPVEIALNPAATAATTTSGLAVAGNSWVMQVGTYNGTRTLTGTLPSMAGITPAGWTTAAGLPYQLTFGWAGSTGSKNEVHELSTLQTQTVNGPLPAYTLSATDNENGALLAGNQAVVSVTPALSAAQGSEDQPATVTTTFPAGIVPSSGTFRTNGYTCTTSGSTVSCTYTPTAAIGAGTTLPSVDIPVTVASNMTAGSYTIASKVSSTDANPATTSHTVTVTRFTASSSGNITFGADETLTATGLPAGATGSVTFNASGGKLLCTIPDITTATSCVVSAPVVASYSVVASYEPPAGSPYAHQRAANASSFTVSKAGTPFTAAATPSTVDYGQVSTLSATGIPAGATGTIAFRDAQTHVLCTATLPATSCGTSATLAPGGYDVTAAYSGDANHQPATATTAVTVSQATPTVTAAVGDPSAAYGATTTLSFSMLTPGAGASETGTVTFTDSHGATLCTVALPGTSCTVQAVLPAGSYHATATYSGDGNYTPATSDQVAFEVTKATPTLTAGATDNTVTYGNSDTLSFSGPATTGPSAATGTVAFRDADGHLLCTATLPATSCATDTTLPADDYRVTATYSGDDNHSSVTSDPFTFTVGRHGSTGLKASATRTTPYGTADTLSYTGLTLTGPNAATGTVTFTSGGKTLCTATLPVTSCLAPAGLNVGHYAVTAAYSGDGNEESATATTAFDVRVVDTVITATAADASVVYGNAEVLSYGGLVLTGPAAATGTVTFRDAGGSLLCSATLPDTSCATPSDLDAGHYEVTATYSGDDNHYGSAADTAFDVAKAPSAVTAVPTTGTHGEPTTLTAAGIPSGATGTLTFTDEDGTVLCAATLPDTSCAAPANVAAGVHTITVAYSGDADHTDSDASADATIARGQFPMTAVVSTTTATAGQPVTITVSGVPSDATGTVTVGSNGTTLCTIALPADACTTSTALAIGDYPLTAAFSGNSDYEPATATSAFTVVAVPSTIETATAHPESGGMIATVAVPSGPDETVTIEKAPGHGTAVIVDGMLVYRADRGYSGVDTVTYRVTLADGSSRLVTVSIGVPTIIPPRSSDPAAALAETGGTISWSLLAGGAMLLVLGLVALLGGRRRRLGTAAS